MNKANLNILHEDPHIIVCVKPHGIATQTRQFGTQDMVSLLKNHISLTEKKSNPYLAVIHRLDQPVRGILVFAKTPFAAKELNKQLTGSGFGKHYRALVSQKPEKDQASLENYLFKDAKGNHSKVCDKSMPDAKFARLTYKVITDEQTLFAKSNASETELDILLDTGRHHQIRVQLSNIGCPIVGDTKYNKSCATQHGWSEICLCAYKLEFKHPKTQKSMTFSLLPE